MSVRMLVPMYRAALSHFRPAVALRPSMAAPRWRVHMSTTSTETTPEQHLEEGPSSTGEPAREGEEPGSRRVFVHNLPFETKWGELKDHFSVAGPVSFATVRPNKGWGIVEFETVVDAQAAIARFADSEFQGRSLFVREDRPAEPRGDDRRERGSFSPSSRREAREPRGDRPPRRQLSPEELEAQRRRTVFVTGLAPEVQWQDLKDHFRSAGAVEFARVATTPEGASRGFGLVRFAAPEDAEGAVDSMARSELAGQSIGVRLDAGSSATRGAGGAGGRPGAEFRAPTHAVVLLNLPLEHTWQDVRALCEPFGELGRVDLRTHPDGTSRGWGIARFKSAEAAEAAIRELNGTVVDGHELRLKLDEKAHQQQRGGRDQSWHSGQE